MGRFIALALTAIAITALAERPAAAKPATLDAALGKIASYAPAAMQYQGTPGLSIGITDRHRTLRVITLGYANVELRQPVTPQTRFAIGSITKSMTSLSLLSLSDAGRLDLNAPVSRYLPWFSINSEGTPIVVHQLLSHTAGLPDDYASEVGYLYDLVALRQAHTIFRPGASWSYSNDGYATAGAILAAVAGVPWSDAVVKHVFEPLGMRDSSPVFTPDALATAAVGYQFLENDRPAPLHPPLVASPPIDFVDPAGSVLSTPEDMARYMRFYLDGAQTSGGTQLLTPATFRAMTTADRLNDGRPAGSPGVELPEAPDFYRAYGYGLAIFNSNGDHLIGHTGGISGYTACMQMNLTRGFGVISFANLVEAPLHPCAIVLYAMRVLRAQQLGKTLPEPPALPDPAYVERPQQYAGKYAAPDGSTLRVTAEAHRLVLMDAGKAIALYPRGPDLFWADDYRFTWFLLSFGRDAKGNVVEMNYGPVWYAGDRYDGPRTFSYPSSWNALTGRYENTYFGQPEITRVVIVKNRLTLDGVDPLVPSANGTFEADTSTASFGDYAQGRPQTLTIDGAHLYRVDLP
ncbi:MAG: beta-lactamase family protein [Candidatus Eremiobacteraeota bacterium]|nr:beta-lactamase family protein [Candidatus Eremiobacteraeota bacterium]MBV9699430.1 beta-lactamase family protein [Candidatus Eremiobacteraeota bacterium]